jgi:hypothetical protein
MLLPALEMPGRRRSEGLGGSDGKAACNHGGSLGKNSLTVTRAGKQVISNIPHRSDRPAKISVILRAAAGAKGHISRHSAAAQTVIWIALPNGLDLPSL